MRTAMIWSAAVLIGVVSTSAIQVVAPMTLLGWGVCAALITFVVAHALYPTLVLRRWSIRLRNAVRRAWYGGRGVRRSMIRRTAVAAFVCSAAVVVYPSPFDPPAAAGATPFGELVHRPAIFGAWMASRSAGPELAAATRPEAKASVYEPTREWVDSERATTTPGWSWLLELIFMPPEPAA